MMKLRCRSGLLAAFAFQLLLPVTITAQQNSNWIVKPEWVKAHEEFLASDVLAGRKSATRDEQIAATYVASEFLGYGLSRAPGMSEYIQTGEILSHALDGHATLSAGSVVLKEGADFDLLMTSGSGLKGSLISVPFDGLAKTKLNANQVSLIINLPPNTPGTQVFNPAVHMGSGAVVVERDDATDRAVKGTGGVPRGPLYVEGEPIPKLTTFIAISHEAIGKLLRLPAGTSIELTIHEVAHEPQKTYNAIGYLAGTDPNAGTILLSAHLDHLGIGRAVNGDNIYNGANDDASGTTAVLELAHALGQGPRPKRSILFVCYGSEEIGALGSKYFIRHSPIDIKTIVANVEFEMIGVQDPKTPKNTLLFTGWERSTLGPALRDHGALIAPDPYPEQRLFERSDNYSLATMGIVAHTTASWGNPTYHKPNDDLAHLNFDFLTSAIQSFIGPIQWLATSDFVPVWNPGQQPVPR